ncbi:hypothetical protein KSC_068950 [Ktedonobacter sp. SOSP1-52]|nr:hypothetical protein KSC_068950 [Ktedonobacter sp. SOSP1-52]
MAPRHLAWLFLHAPEHLEKQEQQMREHLLQIPNLARAYRFTQHFATMLKERNVQLLDAWLCECQTSGINE